MSGERAAQTDLSDDDVLSLFEETDDPVLSTLEIADQLPVRRWGVREKLREMARDDRIEFKVFSADLTVWWPPEE